MDAQQATVERKYGLRAGRHVRQLAQDLAQITRIRHPPAVYAQVMTQQVGTPRQRQRVERLQGKNDAIAHGGGIDRCQFAGEVGQFAEMGGTARQRQRRIGKDIGQFRQNLVAQEIPAQAPVIIALVVDPVMPAGP